MLSTADTSHQKKKVYFWDGIIADPIIFETYQVTLSKLLNGEYTAISLEKLRGLNPHFFSIRVNDTHRLIFTTVIKNGKPYAYIKEEVLEHRYGKFFRKYLKKTTDELIKEIQVESEEKNLIKWTRDDGGEWRKGEKIEASELTDFISASIHEGKCIELNDEQEQAIKAKMPFCLVGPPGSGKTSSACDIILQSALKEENFDESEKVPEIVYVTHSLRLVRHMQKWWDSVKKSGDGNQYYPVKFITNAKLLEEIDHSCSRKTKVKQEDFVFWFLQNKSGFIANFKREKDYKPVGNSNEILKNPLKIYQEYRIISGCADKNAYQQLGEKDCHFPKPDRLFLYFLYKTYLKFLNENSLLDVAFHPIKETGKYDCMVVDEAQDCSNLELWQLFRLTINGQIVFCYDDNQNLVEAFSKTPFLEKIMGKAKFKLSFIQLYDTYRCTGPVIEMAEKVLDIRARLAGLLTKNQSVKIGLPRATTEKEVKPVVWLHQADKQFVEEINKRSNSRSNVVITSKKYYKEAKTLFPDLLVYKNVSKVKGLTYKRVILYQFFNEICFDINELLKEKTESKNKYHRAKKDSGNKDIVPFLNQLYTAITRTKKELIFIQDAPHKIEIFVNELKSILNLIENYSFDKESRFSININAWLKEFDIQIEKGSINKAIEILKKKLAYGQEQINQILQERIKKYWEDEDIDIAKKIFVKGLGKDLMKNKEEFDLITDTKPEQVPFEKTKEDGQEKGKEKERDREKEQEHEAESKTIPILDCPVLFPGEKTREIEAAKDKYMDEDNVSKIQKAFERLLRSKDHVTLLFGSSLERGDSLFSSILNDEKHYRAICAMLSHKRNKWARDTLRELLIHSRYRMADGFLATYLLLLPQDDKLLNLLVENENENENDKEKVKDKDKDKVKEQLIDLISHAVLSTFPNFICFNYGLDILTNLVNRYDFEGINSKLLSEPMTHEEYSGWSCFYWLSADNEGCKFLKAWLNKEPKHALEVTAELLYSDDDTDETEYVQDSHENKVDDTKHDDSENDDDDEDDIEDDYSCAFYKFAFDSDYHAILFLLFKHNPSLIEDSKLESVFLKLNQEKMQQLVSGLLLSKPGCHVVAMILEKNPRVANLISRELFNPSSEASMPVFDEAKKKHKKVIDLLRKGNPDISEMIIESEELSPAYVKYNPSIVMKFSDNRYLFLAPKMIKENQEQASISQSPRPGGGE